MNKLNGSALALVLALFPSCTVEEGPVGDEQASLVADQDGMLAFVNDQDTTTFERLDVDCALRSDSARQILRHRDGKDGLPYTADDDLLDTVEELDGVTLVGPWTLDRLYQCAGEFGYGAEGWVFAAAELGSVVDDALVAAGIDGYTAGICEGVVGEAVGCLPRCLTMVESAAREWLFENEEVNAWIGQSFTSRDEVVGSAAALVRGSAEAQAACWSDPECQALNALIACLESE